MRTALVRGRQEFRTTTLWQIGNWPFPEKRDFLAQVWPLQLAARGGAITDRLCHIAFHDPEHFAELAQIILPFLTPIRRPHARISGLATSMSAAGERRQTSAEYGGGF